MKYLQFTHETSGVVLMQIGNYNLVYGEASPAPDGAIEYDPNAKDMLAFQPGIAGVDKEVCISWNLIHKFVSAIDLEESVTCACADSLKSILGVDADNNFQSIIKLSVAEFFEEKELLDDIQSIKDDVDVLAADLEDIKDDIKLDVKPDIMEIKDVVNENKDKIATVSGSVTDVSSGLTSLEENLSVAITTSEANVKDKIASNSTLVQTDLTKCITEVSSLLTQHDRKFDQYLLNTESNINQLFALANKQLKDFMEAGFDLATKEVSFTASTESLTVAVGRVNLLINQLQLIESQIANFTGVTSVLEALVTALQANFSNLEVAKQSYDNLEGLYGNLFNDLKQALESFQKASASLSDKMLLLDQRDNERLSELIKLLDKAIIQRQSDSKSHQIMGSVDLALKALTTVNELSKKEDTL